MKDILISTQSPSDIHSVYGHLTVICMLLRRFLCLSLCCHNHWLIWGQIQLKKPFSAPASRAYSKKGTLMLFPSK